MTFLSLMGHLDLFSCTFEQFYNFTKFTVTAGGGERLSSFHRCCKPALPLEPPVAFEESCLWLEGKRAFGWAVCPLGAVTSQALHSFILQGQIPVTEPGRQRQNGPCRLPTRGFSAFGWKSHKTKKQTWSRPGSPSAQVFISRRIGQINVLKSPTWATHYPPVSPLSSLAPPQLHINLQKVTISPSLLCCPAVCLAWRYQISV